MRLAIVGSRGIPARYGGFETLAEQLGVRLVERGVHVAIVCEPNRDHRADYFRGIKLDYFPLRPFWRPLYEMLVDTISIARLTQRVDCILVLGYIGAMAFFYPRIRATPLVVNVDGIEWQRAKLRAPLRALLRLFEAISVRTASNVVADSRQIQQYLDSAYGKVACFIPYGGDHCISGAPFDLQYLHATIPKLKTIARIEPDGYYMVVARLEPENLVHTIVSGFRHLKSDRLLLVVGDFSSAAYEDRVSRAVDHDRRIVFLGSVYDRRALDMLRTHCHAYLHGHTVGGTNPGLIEAMYLGAPTVSYRNAFNREVGADTLDYFENERDLLEALTRCETQDAQLRQRASDARSRALVLYNWDKVTDEYLEAIRVARSCLR